MKKDPKIYLEHILESISIIEQATKDIKEAEFLNSVTIQDAVIRRLEIIGEVVKRIPEYIKEQNELYTLEKDCGFTRYFYSSVF